MRHRRTIFTTAALLAAAALTLGGSMYALSRSLPADAAPLRAHTRLLVDPGHGGEDGGTMAENGTLEKDINLSIALTLADFMRLCGFDVTMTRDRDISIGDATAKTVREKKVSDIRQRLVLYEQAQVVISIHENHFSGTQYHGTQVFYSPNAAASQPLAAAIRESVLTTLQPDNRRELKKGDKSIYLLHKTTVPAVLVECGFLSNATERTRLEDPLYRQEMAIAIGAGALYFGA